MSSYRTANFGLRHRAVAFISSKFFRNFVYTVRHGLATGMRRKGGLGFLPFGAEETAESRFLSRLDLAGKTVYDIGGFEGVLTLFFASKAASVITYEANPRNCQRCLENVQLNALNNVRVFGRGVSSAAGEIELAYDPLMPGAGSGNQEISHHITASVNAAQTIRVPVVTLDSDIEKLILPAPDFIKIDIEGMELHALKGMRETLAARGPELFIELHGAEPPEKTEIAVSVVGFLEKAGYRIYDVENQKYLTVATLDPHPPSHLYCTKEKR